MEKNDPLHYGEILQQLFKKDGKSVRELSKLTNRSTQAIYNVFRTKSPRLDVVLNLTKFLSTEMKLNAIDIILADSEAVNLSRQQIVDHFTQSHKKLSESTLAIERRLDIKDQFYPQKVEEVLSKLNDMEERFKVMNELVETKNQLIEQLLKNQ